MAAQVSGGTPVTARPVTTTGYNTFGEVTEAQDPNGNTTTYVYDADGRPVSQALPPYTPPGGTGPVSGTTVTTYNTLGQVTAQTDPLGNVTRYAYDQLGHRTGQTDPGDGVTSTSYDADGEALSVTGPTGAAGHQHVRLPGPPGHRDQRGAVPVGGLLHHRDLLRGHPGEPERDVEVAGHLTGPG